MAPFKNFQTGDIVYHKGNSLKYSSTISELSYINKTQFQYTEYLESTQQ